MNFDCVGKKESGEYYMKFREPFNLVERIQLLQRSILVNSFAYYELDSNILTDFQYDANAMQLVELMKNNPEEAKRSRYHEYFHDYCPTEEDVHYTSGFDLLHKVESSNKELYRHIAIDAHMALDSKRLRGDRY